MQELVCVLQQLPSHCHWAYADEDLLRCIPIREPVKRGPRGRALRSLIKAARSVGIHWPLVWLVALFELLRLLSRQFNVPMQAPASLQVPFRVFVGFGAGPEEQLYKRYCAEQSGQVLRLDQTSIESFAQWHRVGMVAALSAFCHAAIAARQAMKLLPVALGEWECEFLTFIGMRLADYSYRRAWFGWLQASAGSRIEDIAFLAVDTCAFAVSDQQLRPSFIQHGLIYYCLLAGFVRVEVLTADEANFFGKLLPHAKLVRTPQNTPLAISELSDVVLIASIYGEPDYIARINSFLYWAESVHLSVCVRPHPREDRTFWLGRGVEHNLAVDASDAGFFQALTRLKPRLVVSWFSTALADALAMGVIPVTVCHPDERAVADMPYPLFQRCLSWPRDKDMVARLLRDDEYYEAVLFSLNKETMVS